MASSLDVIGPMAKNIEDLAIVLEAISGKDPMDGTTGDKPVPNYRSALTGDVKGMKIGLPKEYFIEGIHPEVEKSVREAAKVLESLGATLVDVSLPHTKYAIATYYVITPCEVSSNMARYDGVKFGHTVDQPKDLLDYYERVRSEGFGTEVKRRIMIGTYALSAGYYDAYYRQAQKVRTILLQEFEAAFRQVDLMLSPVSPHPSFKVGAHSGDPLAMYLEDVFLSAQPMAGIPALSVPCGITSDNLPIGLQLMGPQWGEESILKAAHAYEKAAWGNGFKKVSL
jgi:aspartyl-tRNA(Asn)/glutamyl-tRNA(Gln) amidotransferase subunit A